MTTKTKKLEVEVSYLNKLVEKYEGDPHLINKELRRVLGEKHFNRHTSTFRNVRITGEGNAQNADLPLRFYHYFFSGCEFVGLTFTSKVYSTRAVVYSNFKTCSFYDVSFRNCVISATVDSCMFEKVTFSSVTVKECDIYECEFKDVTASYVNIIQISGIEVYTVANTGTFDGCINYFPTLNNGEGYVVAGCWSGTLKDAVVKMDILARHSKEYNRKFRAVLSYFHACNPQAGIEIPDLLMDK